MRNFIFGLFFLVLLVGCSSFDNKPSAVVVPPTKTLTDSINDRYKNIESIGLYQPRETNGDLSLGTYHYVRNYNKEDFSQGLSTSKATTNSVKKEFSKDTMSLIVIADSAVHSYKYLTDEGLLYHEESSTLFSVPSGLSSQINQTVQDKDLANPNTLNYKGVPYFGILLAESINPNELTSIGQIKSTTYYIKKNASQPVDLIYFILDKNGFPKGNYMFSAYQLPPTLRSGQSGQ
jgi:hypothetical protein